MDLGTTFDMKEIIAGLIGAAGIYAYARKKYSFDNLEITKSNTERELIELLREQIKASSEDLTAFRTKYNDLEERTQIIGKERDEALQEIEIVKADLKRYESKIKNLEEIIDRLTDALETTLARLNSEIDGSSTTEEPPENN